MKEKKCKCAASAVLPWQVDIFGCERGYLREQEGSLLHGIVPEAAVLIIPAATEWFIL
jgi:hypothetical protein